MKRLSNLLAALVFASLVIFMSCGGGGGDDGPSALETAVNNLTVTGGFSNPTSVTTGVGAADGDWSSFGITFSGTVEGGDYAVSGVPTGFEDVWSDGTWTINSGANVITKTQGGQDTDISAQIEEGALTMSFNVSTQGGRTSGIDGNWTFVFE